MKFRRWLAYLGSRRGDTELKGHSDTVYSLMFTRDVICWPQVCFASTSNEVKGKKNKSSKASHHLCKLSNDFFGLSKL